MTVKTAKSMVLRLGTSKEDGSIVLDTMILIDSRLLLVANSGGGKSYLIRVLCEQLAGKVPTIILDREGEFSTLREKHDLVLIGEGGEAETAIATSAKLARTLVELGVSAVINLYELTKQDKRKFVRIFLESLLSLPRNLWRPMVVIVDEAHDFCPESGREAESRQAVIDLMDKGRKRGICGVLATQRFAKLSKDAAGEANNICVGRVVQDVDQRRAADLLGFSGRDDRLALRDLAPGEWYGFGPAFVQTGIAKFTVNRAETTHPKAGQRHNLQPPAPSKAILKVAPELAALKQKVAEEKDELTRLRDEVKTLRSTRGKVSTPTAPAPKIHTTKIEAAARAEGYAQAIQGLDPLSAVLNDLQATLTKIGDLASQGPTAIRSITRILATVGKTSPRAPKSNGHAGSMTIPATSKPIRQPRVQVSRATSQSNEASSDPRLGRGGERRMLVALAQHPDGLDRVPLGLYSQVAESGGSFGTYLSNLKANGWITVDRKHVTITESGLAALGDFDPLPEGQALVDYWLNWVSQGGERRMLEAVLAAGEDGIDRDTLGEVSGVARTGGSFGTYLSNLKAAQLVEYGRGDDIIRAAPTLLGA